MTGCGALGGRGLDYRVGADLGKAGIGTADGGDVGETAGLGVRVGGVGRNLLGDDGEDGHFADDVAETGMDGLSGDWNGLEGLRVVWEVREPCHRGESCERATRHEVSDEAEVHGGEGCEVGELALEGFLDVWRKRRASVRV